jgi:hypothetical protein
VAAVAPFDTHSDLSEGGLVIRILERAMDVADVSAETSERIAGDPAASLDAAAVVARAGRTAVE